MATGDQVTYHEPLPPQLLSLLSFLYLLQVARNAADWAIGAGLVGECAIGVIYGPIAHILDVQWQQTFVALGYVGLVLIVFEGGLSMSPNHFLPSLPTAALAAAIGILAPMALTFASFSAFGYPLLWSFTSGSALASTSLGTTFFVLKTQGHRLGSGVDLARTRIGAVLQGAALIDDVVALVLLSVIIALGQDTSASSNSLGWTVGRPIVASMALAVGVPLVAWFAVRPCWRAQQINQSSLVASGNCQLLIGVATLSGLVAAAYYAGTTMLLGAFLAGTTLLMLSDDDVNFAETFDTLVGPVQRFVLVPLFFGSIGITVPFLDLFTGELVWKGIVYALLMTIGKVLVGVAVLLVDSSRLMRTRSSLASVPSFLSDTSLACGAPGSAAASVTATELASERSPGRDSCLAAGFVGFAMIARGEIGVLVLQVAYNSRGQSRILGTEAYLVGLWAVMICTIVGPVVFAAVVKRFGLRIVNSVNWGRGEGRHGAK
ncbi:hypothetical protein ACM66B_002504 [Microbotryomycetes sp. NB124-2]